MPNKIAVIGAGPKAAALAAKVDRMRASGDPLELTIFEKSECGAAWSGRHGYTDGVQHLCTPAERDVGFPYLPGVLAPEMNTELYAQFSWATFLVENGEDYVDWVDRGRRPPSHRQYATYLKWVIERADATYLKEEVTGLRHVAGKWTVTTIDNQHDGFDGVVVTGPGPARRGFTRPDDPRVTDGSQFWRTPGKFIIQASKSSEAIVIAGSGGTAAAIAAHVSRHNHRNRPILIVGNQAALFTRAESFFENSLYSDNDAWFAIAPETRQEFTTRLNRGVVWANVSSELSSSPNIKFLPGRVENLTISAPVEAAPGELVVNYRNHQGPVALPASLVVDAAGFDAWWFINLLNPDVRLQFEGANENAEKALRSGLSTGMKNDLSFNIEMAGLHAPMLSQTQGPGFGTLMVLGSMSDRILNTYQTRN